MGGKHSQRLLTPLHYCANGMIVPPHSVARSLDLSVCAHLQASARGRSPGDGGGGGAASRRSLMCSRKKTSTYSKTSVHAQRRSEISVLLANIKCTEGAHVMQAESLDSYQDSLIILKRRSAVIPLVQLKKLRLLMSWFIETSTFSFHPHRCPPPSSRP